jgi:phosphate transport system substrate-binding protein
MKKQIRGIAVGMVLALAGTVAAQQATINGAGATFPYPIYAKWAYLYERAASVKVNYQSIGSGGGIAQIKARTVDFGGSDAPLSAGDLERSGLIQFPMVIGGVVPIVNLPGITAGQIKLTPDVLASIFLGSITKWDDPAIKALNAGVNLPSKAITVVHRADGSGTSWVFTNYLTKVSPAWKARVGFATSVEWPVGVGGKGNEGVAAYVRRIQGAIGYVEYAYAIQNRIAYAQMKNRAGKFVSPDIATFQAAAANADWANAPGFYMVLTDQPGDNSWPITGATFILVHKAQRDAARAKAMLAFFNWCYANGDAEAEKLHYIPMPRAVVQLVQAKWKSELSAGGAPVWE